jgi:CTP synthase (UTP-ammonia lyase)
VDAGAIVICVCGACGGDLEGSTFIGAAEDADDDGKPQWLLLVQCSHCMSARVVATVTLKPHRRTIGELAEALRETLPAPALVLS